MVEIRDIARNLECGAHGIWFNRKRTNVSYPEDGNLRCFAIEENSFWFKHRNRCIAEAIRLFPPRGVILDVGGGNGYVSLALQNSGLDVILLEPGYRGVLHGHTRGLRTTICSTLEDAGFKPHTIPAVGLFDVLEHVEHDVDFLRTLNTLLLPNGSSTSPSQRTASFGRLMTATQVTTGDSRSRASR